MTNTLHLIFALDNGKTLTIQIADPKDGLTQAEADAVAATIIGNAAIVKDGAIPLSLKQAYVRTVATQSLD